MKREDLYYLGCCQGFVRLFLSSPPHGPWDLGWERMKKGKFMLFWDVTKVL